MKIPKQMNHYCPKCKKHTEQTVTQMKVKGRSATHPLSRGSDSRLRKKGQKRGYGSLGRYSKPPIARWKRTGAKTSKKVILKLTCKVCKKSSQMHIGRLKKIEIAEK